jgi:hypothetical protein
MQSLHLSSFKSCGPHRLLYSHYTAFSERQVGCENGMHASPAEPSMARCEMQAMKLAARSKQGPGCSNKTHLASTSHRPAIYLQNKLSLQVASCDKHAASATHSRQQCNYKRAGTVVLCSGKTHELWVASKVNPAQQLPMPGKKKAHKYLNLMQRWARSSLLAFKRSHCRTIRMVLEIILTQSRKP